MNNQEVHKYLRRNKQGIRLSEVEETKRNYVQVTILFIIF